MIKFDKCDIQINMKIYKYLDKLKSLYLCKDGLQHLTFIFKPINTQPNKPR